MDLAVSGVAMSSAVFLFGAVVSPLHARVTFHRHHVALSDVTTAADGAVTFNAYVDAGPDTGAAYIVAARLVDASGAAVAEWDGAALAALPASAIRNVYPYVWASHFRTEKIGFSGETGARATITLPPPTATDTGAPHEIVLEAINGATWRAPAGR
jgi:hypothetical protein